MRDKQIYLVPDYYPYFQCKMGKCRHACCDGWPISISSADYFHLVSVSCSHKLRRRLDTALHILPHPDNEAYAVISPRYDGTCPLRFEDGRCGLQVELGEKALADVCRLYPRGVRMTDYHECSCSNSCEAVPELFLNHPDPIRFIRIPLDFDLPEPKQRENIFATGGRGQEIRLHYIRIIQNREQPLPDRLMTLGIALQDVEKALRADDASRIDELLSRPPVLFSGTKEKPDQEQLDTGMKIMQAMMELVDERSSSVRSYGEEVLNWFGSGSNDITRYERAIANFEAVLPDHAVIFEHLMVNHMFFEQFPFQDRPVSVPDEFYAICSVYTLLRFLSVGWTVIHPSLEAFIDVCSALFRLIEHTAFDSFGASLFKRLGCTTPEQVYDLIRL